VPAHTRYISGALSAQTWHILQTSILCTLFQNSHVTSTTPGNPTRSILAKGDLFLSTYGLRWNQNQDGTRACKARLCADWAARKYSLTSLLPTPSTLSVYCPFAPCLIGSVPPPRITHKQKRAKDSFCCFSSDGYARAGFFAEINVLYNNYSALRASSQTKFCTYLTDVRHASDTF